MTVDMLVLGGGIAGLAAAWTGQRLGAKVRLLEAGAVVGGKLRTHVENGYITEDGPHTFLGRSPAIWRLLDELDERQLAQRVQGPAWRFVHRLGRTRKLPTGPVSLLTGGWLSSAGKLRAAIEPLVARRSNPDESVHGFFARRFGAEVAEGLVAPFVTGMFAGDAREIGLYDAFPQLGAWEREGSSVLGALRRRAPGGPAGLFSMRGGMAKLPLVIAERLGEVVRTSTQAQRLLWDGTSWTVIDQAGQAHSASTLVLATPPAAAHQLLAPHGVEGLGAVTHCAMALVHLGGVDRGESPRGFGALIPRGHGVRALGMLLTSSLFPDRCPAGRASAAVFFGGSQDPSAMQLSDVELIELAQTARREVFGASIDVEMARVVRWPVAIPQYRVGHRAQMARVVDQLRRTHPSLRLAGAHLAGVSVGDACESGLMAAEGLSGLWLRGSRS